MTEAERKVKAKWPHAEAVWKYDMVYIIASNAMWSRELSEGRSTKKLAWISAARRIDEGREKG